MKRPLHLSLAIALAISGIDAMALGLGSIQVKSRLNQPLDAEIPVIQSNPGEAEGLIIQLASAEDFERVGLDRSRSAAVPLEFKLVHNAQGQAVIRVTTADIVREPFLDFLIEANWTNGRLLREYTVLLDPPVTAAAIKGSTTMAASAEPARAPVESLPEPQAKPVPRTPTAPPPVAKAPAAAPAPRPAATAGGDYTVSTGDTLSAIARQVRPGADVSLDQTMLALFKANPSAFYKDNINALKSGAILRVPDAEAIRAVASLREAAEQVRGQVEDWRGSAGSPTRVARTAAPGDAAAAPSTGSARAKDESRLSIVPPSVGKDSLAASDRVGASSAESGNGDTRLKGDLARTREALASREQETGELKSRVRELEDIKNKNDRLLSLKDSEIAELQQRLKALQDGAPGGKPAAPAATPAPAAVAAPTGTPAAPTKDDIWGKSDTTATPGSQNATASGEPATATPAPPSTPEPAPATDAGDQPPPPATPPSDTITATGSDTGAAPAAAPAQPPAAKPAAPAQKAPPKPAAAKPAAPVDSPWYADPLVLGGGGAIGLLLILLGAMGLRKRSKPAERSSIAESFGHSPLPAAALAEGHPGDAIEAALRAQIDGNPADLGARLELLSHFYAERRVEDFEIGALDMNDYVIDRSQPEWLEVQAMGRELAPGNPLFSGQDAQAATPDEELDEDESFVFDAPLADPFDPTPAPAPAAAPPETDFAFDFEPAQPSTPAAPVAQAAPVSTDDEGFDFDDLPPLDFQSEIDAAARDTAERTGLAGDVAEKADDDFFVGDDAVDTKLDLARTYLDMGDPEGARAMLDEVLNEGSQVQKDEARRLLDGIA